jgi:hypothetical protein
MARYRKVDAKFNALSERAKLVFFYELAHPNLTMLGAKRATVPGGFVQAALEMQKRRLAPMDACPVCRAAALKEVA